MDLNEQIYQMKSGGLTYDEISDKLGMSFDAVRGRYRRYRDRGEDDFVKSYSSGSVHYDGSNDVYVAVSKKLGVIVVNSTTHENIVSKYSNLSGNYTTSQLADDIGMDRELLKEYIRLSGITHSSLPVSDVDVISRDDDDLIEEIVRKRKASLRLKANAKMNRLLVSSAEKWWDFQNAVEHAKSVIGNAPSVGLSGLLNRTTGEKTAVISTLCDAHFGKVSKVDDSGFEYNTDIAGKNIIESAEYFCGVMGDVSRVIIPFGGDDEHVDNYSGTTTMGTNQDVDGTPTSNLALWYGVVTQFINTFVDAGYKVNMVLTSGNHNHHTSIIRGMMLASHYKDDRDVDVDYDPKLRKYVRYGVSLIGLGHCSKEKNRNLPMLMANEAREDWGKSGYAYWFAQHTHNWESFFMGGVNVVRMPSICPLGRWGHSMGFHNHRTATAYVIDFNQGMERIEVFNIS